MTVRHGFSMYRLAPTRRAYPLTLDPPKGGDEDHRRLRPKAPEKREHVEATCPQHLLVQDHGVEPGTLGPCGADAHQKRELEADFKRDLACCGRFDLRWTGGSMPRLASGTSSRGSSPAKTGQAALACGRARSPPAAGADSSRPHTPGPCSSPVQPGCPGRDPRGRRRRTHFALIGRELTSRACPPRWAGCTLPLTVHGHGEPVVDGEAARASERRGGLLRRRRDAPA